MTIRNPRARHHHVQERVRWSDVDASGFILWSAYTRLIEAAETELFRAAGYPYATLWDRLDIWLPRVQFHLIYRSPARLGDLLDIALWLVRVGRSSIRFEFAVSKTCAVGGAEGYLVSVAIIASHERVVEVPRLLVVT